MMGQDKAKQKTIGPQMLKLLTSKELQAVSGGPKGPVRSSGASTCTYIGGKGGAPCRN